MAITVLIADDHGIVRDGLRLLLEAQSDIEVAGEAENGRDAVTRARELRPDVAIVDIAMPQLNGIEAIRHMIEDHPDLQVVVLSMHATAEHIYRALDAGALGYVFKESAGAEVVDAVRTVYAGRRYLGRKISSVALDHDMLDRVARGAKSPVERLSIREREVLQLVVEGKSSAAIAETVHLSQKTVETYRSRLMQKLGTPDIPSLVKFALEHGLTPPG